MRYALVLLAVAACTPTPNPSPMPPDAAPPADCAAACASLPPTCAEGKDPSCGATLAKIQAARLVRNPATGMPLTCGDQMTPAVLSALGWCK